MILLKDALDLDRNEVSKRLALLLTEDEVYLEDVTVCGNVVSHRNRHMESSISLAWHVLLTNILKMVEGNVTTRLFICECDFAAFLVWLIGCVADHNLNHFSLAWSKFYLLLRLALDNNAILAPLPLAFCTVNAIRAFTTGMLGATSISCG